MIHYHGTPIGGTIQSATDFLLARHALVSHANPGQMSLVAECCQSFVLDNGAFSYWKKDMKVDLDEYAAWVRDWMRHPGFDWCLAPDDIDGGEKENDEMLDAWSSYGLDSVSVPVWHLHESLKRLERFASLAAARSPYPALAFGSSGEWSQPGSRPWWYRMAEAMRTVCDEHGRPRCRLHGLRMLDPRIFEHLPFASADSTNAGRNNNSRDRFGIYRPSTPGQRAIVIAQRIEAVNSSPVWAGLPFEVDEPEPDDSVPDWLK